MDHDRAMQAWLRRFVAGFTSKEAGGGWESVPRDSHGEWTSGGDSFSVGDNVAGSWSALSPGMTGSFSGQVVDTRPGEVRVRISRIESRWVAQEAVHSASEPPAKTPQEPAPLKQPAANPPAAAHVPTSTPTSPAPVASSGTEHQTDFSKIQQSFERKIDRVPYAESNAWTDYIGAGNEKVNEYLRTDGRATAKTQATVAALDALMRRSSLPEDSTLYRGALLSHAAADQLVAGRTIHDRGFVSTSTDENEAVRFSVIGPLGKSPATHAAVLFHIHAPAGTRGMMGLAEEKEWVLPRGKSFRIDSVHRNQFQHFEFPITVINATYLNSSKKMLLVKSTPSAVALRFIWQDDEFTYDDDDVLSRLVNTARAAA